MLVATNQQVPSIPPHRGAVTATEIRRAQGRFRDAIVEFLGQPSSLTFGTMHREGLEYLEFERDHLLPSAGRREIDDELVRKGVSDIIDSMLPSPNYMYALRITGDFGWVTTRTVERQQAPYPTLVEATDGEEVVRFEDVRGVVAGFRTPLFEAAISVPGCHAHFIDDDRERGGHLIDFEIRSGVAEICIGTDLELRLPLTSEFESADLTPDDLQEQLHKAEHAGHN